MVEVQLSIACLVALAADLVERLEERQDLIEILQARDVLLTDVLAFFGSHAFGYTRNRRLAQVHLSCVVTPL